MNDYIVEEVRKIVVDICNKLNRLDDYNCHISVVETLAVDLGKRFSADEKNTENCCFIA
jgi:hypothetical protein